MSSFHPKNALPFSRSKAQRSLHRQKKTRVSLDSGKRPSLRKLSQAKSSLSRRQEYYNSDFAAARGRSASKPRFISQLQRASKALMRPSAARMGVALGIDSKM